MYDLWSPYDPLPEDRLEEQVHSDQRLIAAQQTFHVALLDLRPLIDDPQRDAEQVDAALRPFHEYLDSTPPLPDDIPEIERLCRLAAEKGGAGQGRLQEALLRLVGNAAEPRSLPFLLDMLRFTKRGDSFGPERRQLALWALARLARWHNLPEAYAALLASMDERKAEVRMTAMDLILDAYLDAGRDAPLDVFARMRQMAKNDPDEAVRRLAKRFLHESWARKGEGDIPV